MKALIERLKSYRVSADVNHPVHPTICDEALQEIERLTAINAELLAACEDTANDLVQCQNQLHGIKGADMARREAFSCEKYLRAAIAKAQQGD